MTDYKVAIDVYNGPLDLLLYLIRRDEVDIYDIPIARVTSQYLAYVELLHELDPEGAGEFLVLAATLMEIKSRTLLPTPPPEESEEEIIDPRLELVRQLLEYKKFKDAAQGLEESAIERAQKFARSPVAPAKAPDEVDLENLDVWDLVGAFQRLLDQTGQREAVHEVGIDDTPIALHAEDIVDSIERAGGTQRFDEIFAGRTRPEMIGLFLALLELIRQHRVRASQERAFDSIYLHLLELADDEDAGEFAALDETSSASEAESGTQDQASPRTETPDDEPPCDPTREYDHEAQ